MPNFVNEYKTIFLGMQDKPSNFLKTSSIYWYMFCNPPKATIESFEPSNIGSKTYNAKFFLGKRGNLETSQEHSSYIGVSHKFPINLFLIFSRASIESSKWSYFASRLYNTQFGQLRQTHFSGKERETVKLFRNFPPIFAFAINLFWNLARPKSNLLSYRISVWGFIMSNFLDKGDKSE